MKNIITFPNRGDLPPDIEGYDRDPGNPHVFRMKWIPCELRVVQPPCKQCPGESGLIYCDFFDKPAEQNECNNCGGKTKVPKHVIGRVIEETLEMNSGAHAVT